MEIQQLEYFLAVAKYSSLTKAADALYTTQPHVSMVIRSLEKELGVPLFKRRSKGMELTEEGIRISLRLSVAIIGPLSLILVYFSHPLLSWFTSDPDIIRNGMQAILWNIPVYFLYAINQVYLGALKGLGKTTFPMICTLVCYCTFRVLWCQFLIPVFHSMIVVYTSYDVSWVIMIAMLLPVYKKTLREKEQYCLLHAA